MKLTERIEGNCSFRLCHMYSIPEMCFQICIAFCSFRLCHIYYIPEMCFPRLPLYCLLFRNGSCLLRIVPTVFQIFVI